MLITFISSSMTHYFNIYNKTNDISWKFFVWHTFEIKRSKVTFVFFCCFFSSRGMKVFPTGKIFYNLNRKEKRRKFTILALVGIPTETVRLRLFKRHHQGRRGEEKKLMENQQNNAYNVIIPRFDLDLTFFFISIKNKIEKFSSHPPIAIFTASTSSCQQKKKTKQTHFDLFIYFDPSPKNPNDWFKKKKLIANKTR